MHSSMALSLNDIERAIRLSRRAVELAPEDIDARVAPGNGLYDKIKTQGEDFSPADYNECVKTWLIVYRNIIGDEAALSFRGVSLPFANKFFEDEDRAMIARSMLLRLCGHVPRCWETNKKYLSKVLRPETTVAGEIMKTTEAETRQ